MTKARDLADLGNGVATADIVDANVTTAKIADANVTTAKIADVNVTQGKLADQAVNESKLQVSNAPTNGYMLTAESGNTGGLTWAAAPTSSTAFGAVGTYIIGRPANNTNYAVNSTASGLYATIMSRNATGASLAFWKGGDNDWDASGITPTSMSGTWRAMNHSVQITTNTPADGQIGLWVRIS